ncbi:MAG: metal-dependent hydrolase [Tabrizicola sp.]|nr:metal-dependent hydrolase [Tabrizicola sp.]
MLTAHLHSGYVLARALPPDIPRLMPVALVGAVLPDIDMVWFHLVDNGAFHHHRYWVHVPVFWLAVAAVALPLAAWLGYLRTAAVFFAAILVHLVLDSIGGGILWGAPISDHLFEMVTVPAAHGHWILSFMLHWTFLLELLIWAAAAFLWFRRGVEV